MRKPIRVLVVDDFKIWREWLRSKLVDCDRFHIVEEASNGNEALTKARQLSPDLIVLDIGMPGLSGIETASLLRAHVPNAKIIFLSQNDDFDLVRTVLNDGASGYVLKAEAENDLLPSIQAVLEGGIFSSKRLGTKTRPEEVPGGPPNRENA